MAIGSSWNIWDLHLHTPCSVLHNEFGSPDNDETWNRYVDTVEIETTKKGIVALGITDYFTIEGYKRLRNIQSTGRLQNLLLIPNIEFRIDKVIYRTKNNTEPKRLNLHVLFSPNIDIRQIEEGFLHDLDFVSENEPFNTPKTEKLKIFNLEKFGKELQSQHPKFLGQTPFYTGCLNAVVQTEKIKKFLEEKFKGDYLLVLANENLELMSWDGQDHAVRKQLIQMSHAIFSSSSNDREFCLGKHHPSVESFISEFKSLKPCLWGSDSHSYEERFLEPDKKRYCWIKGDVTWEGFKQVLFEPEDRVAIQEFNPEPEKSIYTLSNLSINETEINTALKIDAFKSDLNSNLIAIIGGRGSGKTALLDIIASSFPEGEKLSQIQDSFFHRLYVGDKSRDIEANQPVLVTLHFKSGEKFQKPFGTNSINFEKSDVMYLTQNHFDEYTENPDKLNQHIFNLVFDKYLDDKIIFDDIRNDISNCERDIQSINLNWQQLRSEIDGVKDSKKAYLLLKNGEKVDILQRIDEIERKLGSSNERIECLTVYIDNLRNTKRTIISLNQNLENLSSLINDFLFNYSNNVTSLNDEISQISSIQQEEFPTEIIELQKIMEMIGLSSETLESISQSNNNLIADYEKKVGDLQGVDKQIAGYHQKINDINSELLATDNILKDINEKENRIIDLENKRLEK